MPPTKRGPGPLCLKTHAAYKGSAVTSRPQDPCGLQRVGKDSWTSRLIPPTKRRPWPLGIKTHTACKASAVTSMPQDPCGLQSVGRDPWTSRPMPPTKPRRDSLTLTERRPEILARSQDSYHLQSVGWGQRAGMPGPRGWETDLTALFLESVIFDFIPKDSFCIAIT